MRLILTIFVALNLAGCSQYGETTSSGYFNLDSLISSQTNLLRTGQYFLEKTGFVNGQRETEILPFDTSLWANELEIFGLVDIDKPGTVNAFDVKLTEKQAIYQLKPQEKQQGVIMHRITYHDAGWLQLFEAFFREENQLYQSERNYRMTFDEKGVLASYELTGRQKVAFGDWVSYEVVGKVVK